MTPLELTLAAELWLARCLYLEAGWDARTDHAAILYVLRERQLIRGDQSLGRTARAYCVGLQGEPRTGRQRLARRLPRRAGRYRNRFRALREFVRRWAAGEIANPCPGAKHWAARWLPSRRRPARCLESTANQFYR